jgi:hypothetical protein
MSVLPPIFYPFRSELINLIQFVYVDLKLFSQFTL